LLHQAWILLCRALISLCRILVLLRPDLQALRIDGAQAFLWARRYARAIPSDGAA
jgi:hypothetical protein